MAGQMVQATADRFIKFNDVVLEIGQFDTSRNDLVVDPDTLDVTAGLDTTFGLKELNCITTTNLNIDKTDQTFNFVGSNGWTDATHLTRRITQSYTAYFKTDGAAAIDPAMDLLMTAGHEIDGFAIFARVMLFLGADATPEAQWRTWIYPALVSNLQHSMPGDNVVEVSFDINSAGDSYYGIATGADATSRPALTILP